MIKRNVEIVAQVFRKFTAAVDGFESYWRTRNQTWLLQGIVVARQADVTNTETAHPSQNYAS